jgi:hypothetical protein
MDNIEIKTGANLSRLLQSTVNIPQAFTELVKNSIQNFSTFTKINLLDDSAVIVDDGQGFDHEKDENGMTSFEKYFVFGNSYDLTGGEGIRLGQMGIGGKLANDKLSHETNIHWTIETKNVHGKCFLVEYKPSGSQFLNEYSPSLTELSANDCSIKTDTGTKITIVSLKQNIQNDGWPQGAIKTELCTFFGFLLPQLEKEGKKFNIYLNNESLDFSYKLPGSNIPIIKRTFGYDYYGELKTGNIEFRLSLVYNRDAIKNHPLKNIDVISKVKICPFHLSDQDMIQKMYDDLQKKSEEDLPKIDQIHGVFSRLIGFISCDELSEVMDNTGMPAKDLSHHGLRGDHPLTVPFYEKVYEVIIQWIIEYIKLNEEENMDILDALAQEVSSLLADYFDEDDLVDLWEDSEGKEDDDDEEPEIDDEQEQLKKFAEYTIDRTWDFDPEPNRPKEDTDPSVPPLSKSWRGFSNKKIKKSKRIRYRIIDFGEDQIHLMSRMDDAGDFTILINSGNPKFKRFSEEKSPFLLAIHIAELLIREIVMVQNPLSRPSDIDKRVSDFYDSQYFSLKKKSKHNE